MDEPRKKLYQIMVRHVPENAVHYCLDLWTRNPFHFKVTRRRNSKLGDYKFDPRYKDHTITINHDLNPYSFLITYVHEVAHLLTMEHKGRRVSPHGLEWQSNYRELMSPLLNDLVFPEPVLQALKKHLGRPKASSCSDPGLMEALRAYDPNPANLVPLSELKEGDIFEFNRSVYKKLNDRRTRVICMQAKTSRKYLISKLAMVRTLDYSSAKPGS